MDILDIGLCILLKNHKILKIILYLISIPISIQYFNIPECNPKLRKDSGAPITKKQSIDATIPVDKESFISVLSLPACLIILNKMPLIFQITRLLSKSQIMNHSIYEQTIKYHYN